MKPFNPRNSTLLVLVFLGIFAFSQVFFQNQPPKVQAQDIDDVLDSFSGDFGFTDKEDLKQENLQNANEQNREDVQIQLEEKRQAEQQSNQQNQQNQQTPATTADVTINFTSSGNDAVVTTSLGPVNGFMGTIFTSMPVNFTYMAVPVGANTLTVNCLASTPGNCQIAIGGIVNATCSPLPNPIANSNAGSTACTVTAPAPLP